MESSKVYQREALKKFGFEGGSVVLDRDCFSSLPDDALNQLLFLAQRKKQIWAAKALLYETGSAIDGELAEEYEGRYLVPVLEGMGGLQGIVSDSGSENQRLASRICEWSKSHDEQGRIKRLVRSLQKRQLRSLADSLRNCLKN